MQADILYSVISLDLPGRVLPLPDGNALTYQDLFQLVGKYAGLATDTPADAAPAASRTAPYPLYFGGRRRR